MQLHVLLCVMLLPYSANNARHHSAHKSFSFTAMKEEHEILYFYITYSQRNIYF